MRKAVVFLFIVMLLSGCAAQSQKENVTLKVLYHSSDEFMNKYGLTYLATKENIDFEIIPLESYLKNGMTEEQYLKIVEAEKPDILYGFNYNEAFIDKGKLLNLDTHIQQAKDFHMDEINSNLLDYLRQVGNGSIYALSPTFTGKATFYNKTLLDELGVEYPTDGMNWGEILALSSIISQASDVLDKEMSSFYYNGDLFGLVMNIADTMKVQYANESGEVTFNTEAWEYIVNLVMESARNGGVSTKDYGSQANSSVLSEFLTGKVAITVEYSYLLDHLQDVDFEWGVVTVPTETSSESFDAMQPDVLFGVSRDSNHIEESVDFIKYVNGEQFAKLNHKSNALSVLPAREEFSEGVLDVDLHAFYSIAPLNFTRIDSISSLEQSTRLHNEANEILKNAAANGTSTADVLKLLQDTMESIMMMEN